MSPDDFGRKTIYDKHSFFFSDYPVTALSNHDSLHLELEEQRQSHGKSIIFFRYNCKNKRCNFNLVSTLDMANDCQSSIGHKAHGHPSSLHNPIHRIDHPNLSRQCGRSLCSTTFRSTSSHTAAVLIFRC